MILLGLALKSILIAAITLGLLHLTRRRSAADRSWLAHLGLFAMVALPLASLALPALSIEVPDALAPAATTVSTINAEAMTPIASDLVRPSTEATVPVAIEAPGPDWTPIAYAVPMIALLAITLLALLRLFALRGRAQVLVDPVWLSALAHAQRRMGFKNGTALLTSSELSSPISWGLMRPVILLNDEALAASGEAEAIIAHELAHVARFDWAKLMLARIATAIFWFNPLAWVLAREAHQLREEAADDAVLAANVVDTDYAQLLVGVARHECKGLLLGAHGISPGRHSLRRRVSRVLDSSLARGTGGRSWVTGFAAGMLVMSAPLAAVTFAPAAPQPPKPPRAVKSSPRAPLAAVAVQAPDAPLPPAATIEPYPPATPLTPHPPVPPAELGEVISSTVSTAVASALTATTQATRSLRIAERARRERRSDEADEYVAMRTMGVTPQYVASIRAAGPQFRNLDTDEIIELRAKGVTPEFIRAVAAAGYGHESADEIGDAAVLGLDAATLREYARTGPHRSLGDLAEMRMLGVTPQYLRAMQRAGNPLLSKQELIKLRMLDHEGRRHAP